MTSLKPKKGTALRSSNSPAIKDREGAVEEVPNREGSKLVSLAEDNRHKTLDHKEIVRAIKITDTTKKIAARGMRMVVQGITSRMTEAERASISIKIMEVSSTIMKEARTIKVARYR
jgi:transcriptional regulator NrdR family protein